MNIKLNELRTIIKNTIKEEVKQKDWVYSTARRIFSELDKANLDIEQKKYIIQRLTSLLNVWLESLVKIPPK